MPKTPSWDFLTHFHSAPPVPRDLRWDGALRLADAACDELRERLRVLPEVLARSDLDLARLGGDPCRHDWRSFRPLQPRREEGWSDWLAFLIAESRTGTLAAEMFGRAAAECAKPAEVRREWTLPGGWRADLGIRLRSDAWVHLEIKVGDASLAKTYDTGAAVRLELGSAPVPVYDYVLLTEDAIEAWSEVAADHGGNFPFEIMSLTWRSVAKGIRRALLRGGEVATWEAWAYGFCGVIEQRILGHPTVTAATRAPRESLDRLAALGALLSVVQGGSTHV